MHGSYWVLLITGCLCTQAWDGRGHNVHSNESNKYRLTAGSVLGELGPGRDRIIGGFWILQLVLKLMRPLDGCRGIIAIKYSKKV